ncbi:MAG: helix-turn-helix domain-containing protein [Mangrovibacterium sp.]
MLGIKQNALAAEVGMSQAMISRYKQRKVIEDDVIEKITKVLKVSPEFIKEMEEDPVTVIIENNTFEGSIASTLFEKLLKDRK